MKQVELIHHKQSRLLLFFAGWGADETPFKAYTPPNSDFTLCYDYRNLDFNAEALKPYQCVNVVGWSMGVWAAGMVLDRFKLPLGQTIAINGTQYPIDVHLGIPPIIYQGTLQGLTDVSLHKFLRRMCGNSAKFRAFLVHTPKRPLSELADELEAIQNLYYSLPHSTFKWQQAIVGSNDRIIPPDNQKAAWQQTDTLVLPTEDAHYEESLFRFYLQDLWTNT